MTAAAPLHGEARRLRPVLEGGNRRQEVARVGEAVRADRAALRQGQRRRVVLADEAPRGPFYRPGAELHAARPQADLAGPDPQPPDLRGEDPAALRRPHPTPAGALV